MIYFDSFPLSTDYLKEAERIVSEREDDANSIMDAYSLFIGFYDSDIVGVFQPILDFAIESLKQKINKSYTDIEVDIWLNIMRPIARQPDELNRHSHAVLNKRVGMTQPDYTFVYYIQLPNNTVGKEGTLEVELNEGKIWFEPLPGSLITFGGDIWHTPIKSPNSTVKRIVLAGNISFQNRNNTVI